MSSKEIISLTPLLFIAFAAISGVLSFRQGLPYFLKIFVAFLWVMLSVEITGNILSFHGMHNQWLYNGFLLVMMLVLPFVYYHLLPYRNLRKVILAYFFIFPVFVLVNTISWQPIQTLQTNNFVLGGTFNFLLAIAYFLHLYRSEDTNNILKDTGFWISSGLLLYFGVHIPMLGMMNYLWEKFPDFITSYFIYVTTIFSIILNLCFAIGYLCRNQAQK
jgi:hypothetical protein